MSQDPSQNPQTQPSADVKPEVETNTINVKVRVYPSMGYDVALSQVNDRSSHLREKKSSSRSNARQSSPSSRVRMRTRSGRTSAAFGAFSYVYSTLNASNRMTSFLYDGNRINVDDTPDSLDMEDNGVFSLLSFVH